MTCLVVGHTIIGHTATFTDHECRVFLGYLPYGQIQYVVGITAARLLYQFGVNLRLISGDTVPFVRQLVRTYSQSSLNRIDLVKSKLQHRYGVTTKAVGVVMEVDTRIADRLAFPYI